MKKKYTLILLFNFAFFFAIAQTHIPYYQGIVDNSTLTSITTNLDEFVAHGVKSVGSAELISAKDWLKSKYLSYGYTDIVEDNFSVSGNTVTNIIVTKQGLVYPDTYVIVDGHYDTINGVGANDNGSGTVLILEIAKLLATIPTEYSIKFINFSAEETGLNGSQHYVDNVVNATTPKLDIKLVFNIDEVGGVNGLVNDTIVCEEDRSTPTYNNAASTVITNELMNCIELYSTLDTELSYAYSSDYIPFENNGEIITGLYEKNETPHAHKPTDVIANMDVNYLFEVIKGSIGAVLHFAIANQTLSMEDNVLDDFKFYPNPIVNYLTINSGNLSLNKAVVRLIDLTGKLIYTEEIVKDVTSYKLPLHAINSGVYLLELNTSSGTRISKKILVE